MSSINDQSGGRSSSDDAPSTASEDDVREDQKDPQESNGADSGNGDGADGSDGASASADADADGSKSEAADDGADDETSDDDKKSDDDSGDESGDDDSSDESGDDDKAPDDDDKADDDGSASETRMLDQEKAEAAARATTEAMNLGRSETATATAGQRHRLSHDELRSRARDAAKDAKPADLDDGVAARSFAITVPLAQNALDGVCWNEFRDVVMKVGADDRQLVVLDCSSLQRVDSLGLGRLLLLADDLSADGGRLVLANAPDGFRAVIRLAGLEEVLPVVESLIHVSGDTHVGRESLGAMEDRLRTGLRHVAAMIDHVRKGIEHHGRGSFEQTKAIHAQGTEATRQLGAVQHYIGEIATRMSAFEQHLNKLTHYFNDRFKEDKTKQQAFDALYEDLKKYRDNFLYQAQKPVFKSLVLLHDDCEKMIASIEDQQAREKVDLLREMLVELLYRNDVEKIEDRPVRFDRDTQKAVRRESTDDPEEDYLVKEVVREGFTWGDKVLRPQEVVVVRYKGGLEDGARSSARMAAISDDVLDAAQSGRKAAVSGLAGAGSTDDDAPPPDARPADDEEELSELHTGASDDEKKDSDTDSDDAGSDDPDKTEGADEDGKSDDESDSDEKSEPESNEQT